MSRLSLTKASLTRQKGLLKTYHDVLPSLDLKRRQLSAERDQASQSVKALVERLRSLEDEVGRVCPMLAHPEILLDGLVCLTDVQVGEENLMGTRLPRVDRVSVAVADYGLLSLPFWVDRVVECLKDALRTRIELQVAEQRLERLREAERTVTQRFNLFDKVLIPRTRGTIKTITIYLADAERAGVVNSKIAKRKKEKVLSR
ncbi:V-type ATP synthase subunit D [Synechococcus sp. BSF8S]|uniref:V-type ATP synthase subunit D n=1 Tax=Synechococcales TaxID=1890424 RepID=UPI0016283679|nr:MULTISPECIES: V-type ATP synthase subunit D [unclassified Synechococcus]MBC1261632.1 V-type ATP synthase subunit D [Synechococcus sp. BSF8S]MBC1264561.1 V-type ATP synthase subunit D [Synechococcus sp. BSA11S]